MMNVIQSHIMRMTVGMLACVMMCACMEWNYGKVEDFDSPDRGLFIVNEGNFQYGNATLSFYNPATDSVDNEVFFRANGMKLGDVAQSMTIHDGLAWVVVNHSHVVFAIDVDTYRERGRIAGLTSPRYIHFVSDTKAYITQLWDNRIAVVDPTRYEITGYIDVPAMNQATGSTEQMVQVGRYVYVNCWSYQNRILKIDTTTDAVVDELTVGKQPNSLVADKYNRLWTITDGGYEGSPEGQERPALYCINLGVFEVDAKYEFYMGDTPSELAINGEGDAIYWINNDVWRMPVEDTRLPLRPLVRNRTTLYYGLTVDPETDEVYIADAIDYQQPGMVYRYSADGVLKDSFTVGITPGAFCWKR